MTGRTLPPDPPPLPERHFKGIWFCADLWTSGELTWTEKALVAKIDSLSSHGKPCFAGNDHLAERLRVTAEHMKHMLADLTSRGFLVRLAFDGRRTLRCAHRDVSSAPFASRQLMIQYRVAKSDCQLEPPAENEKVAAPDPRPFPEQHFKGIWMCVDLWENRELSWTEKALVAEIDSLSSRGKPCFAGNDHLAERLKVTAEHMKHMLADLTSLGYLIRLAFDGRRTLRCASPDVSSAQMGSRQLMAQYRIGESRCRLKTRAQFRSVIKHTSALGRRSVIKHTSDVRLKPHLECDETHPENTSKELQKETTTTPQGYFHRTEPNPANSVVVVSLDGIAKEKPSDGHDIELLSKEFGLSNKQSAEVIGYAKNRGFAYVREKAVVTRSEPRKNVGRAFMAALRDDWQARKASPKKENKVQEPAEPVGWREYIRDQYPKVDITLYPRFRDLSRDIQREILDWQSSSITSSPP